MTKKTHLALALVLFVGLPSMLGAQAASDKGAGSQKPASREAGPREQNTGEKTETLADSEMNFPQPLGPVEFRPPRGTRIALKMTDSSRVVYETIAKQARIAVLFDPDYVPRNINVDLNGVPLEDALKIVAFQARTFWRPVTSDAIFVAQDTQAKRREFEQQVVKTFYFPNITSATDLQDIVNTLRTIIEVQRVQQLPGYQTITVRATPEQMAIADKLVADMSEAKQKTGGQYRLDFKITENGEEKKASARTYSLLIEPHEAGKLRLGSRVPVQLKEQERNYVDVGKNIDCQVRFETEHTVGLRVTVETSGVAVDEHGTAEAAHGNPVIQRVDVETSVTLELGTPAVVGNFQDPASKSNVQIEVTATRTKNRE